MLPAGINGATGQVHVDDDRVILGLSDKVAIASDERLSDWRLSDWSWHSLEPDARGDNDIWRGGGSCDLACRRDASTGRARRRTNLTLWQSEDLQHWRSRGTYLEDSGEEQTTISVFLHPSAWQSGRQCLTLRAYPTGPDSTGASIFARGGDARLVSLTAHQMASVWPEFKRELRRP